MIASSVSWVKYGLFFGAVVSIPISREWKRETLGNRDYLKAGGGSALVVPLMKKIAILITISVVVVMGYFFAAGPAAYLCEKGVVPFYVMEKGFYPAAVLVGDCEPYEKYIQWWIRKGRDRPDPILHP
jgi:hypothetical protein